MEVARDQPGPRPGACTGSRVRPLTLRLVLALALFPIVPTSTFLLTTAIKDYWISKPNWFDDLQFWMLSATVATTLISLWIWRACVAWTAGRYAGTVVATTIPIAQVLWWHPFWPVGCVTDDVLRVCQNTGLVGLWIWLTVWVWWGWRRFRIEGRRRIRMSDFAKRVVLSFGAVPIIVAGYVITFIFLDDVLWQREDILRLCSDLLGCAVDTVLLGMLLWTPQHLCTRQQRMVGYVILLLVAGAMFSARGALVTPFSHAALFALINTIWAFTAVVIWCLIWRATVDWSWPVRLRTAVVACIFVGIAFLSPQVPAAEDWGLFCVLPAMAWGGWMIATMLLWRFRKTGLPARIEESLRCPSCAYSLKGLYGTRCPECGEQPTLDELFAAVVGADDA
ncbi:MAG: hypothetical protein V2A79_02020 [Planctomycetota bacterium]